MVAVNRRQIVRACKSRGWTIQPAALEDITRYLEHDGEKTVDRNKTLIAVLDSMAEKMTIQNKGTVTPDVVQSVLNGDHVDGNVEHGNMHEHRSERKSGALEKSVSSSPDDFAVVSAFEYPRLEYDAIRKQFRVNESRFSLLGTAEDKIAMMAQRYALIHQRILRHQLFRPSNFSTTSGGRTVVQNKLTPIECLLGAGGGDSGEKGKNAVIILGVLIQIEEGQYYLEDPTGQVPVSFQSSIVVDGFFVTEHCILLVEGRFLDGILFIDRLGHPLQEEREASLKAIQQQVSHPFYIPGVKAVKTETTSFVVMSDVHLDQPRVLQQLESLFAKYEKVSVHQIPAFVLMGSFCAPLSNYHQSTQHQHSSNIGNSRSISAIEDLLKLIEMFPKLARHAHFCIIAGPNDYHIMGSAYFQMLPFPPLDKVMKSSLSDITNSKVRNLHFGSNPCRIRLSGQEIVIFRYDLLHLMQQKQVLSRQNSIPVSASPEMSMDFDDNHYRLPHCRLIKTILDQGHLLPVANIPVFWNYDSSMRLYPLPDVLILGGDCPMKPYHEVYGGCNVIHPGSFLPSVADNSATVGGNYSVYTPGGTSSSSNDHSEELSALPEQGTVEFLQIGE